MGAIETVTTSRGKLRGEADDGITRFLGIPFASPPTGSLRWAGPRPVDAWSGERDATGFSASAPQRPVAGGIGELIGIPAQAQAEDCLYLNVWTPAADDARRPVLVWIHGGGNTVGSGTQPRIDGQHLARRGDVVVVTLNYRLGALGFLHAPELGASGNEGLLDQVAALRWVRSEIAAFGGNPHNLTVFGQSAGGSDIGQLMGASFAAGAFDKAVPMSGSVSPPVSRAQASAVSARFAERFGGFDAMRAVPPEELIAFQEELVAERLRFGPVLDGQVIEDDASVGVEAGLFTRGMPLLVGSTLDEFALFSLAETDLDDAGLARRAARLLPKRGEALASGYRDLRAKRGASIAPLDVWNALMTDSMFRIPAVRTAEMHGTHTEATWMYLFDYPSPALDGRLGACHSIDIPFVWGTTQVENMRAFCGSGGAVQALGDRMMDTWLAFARSGDPNHDALPAWPRYDKARRATMRLGETCRVEDAPLDGERALWESLA